VASDLDKATAEIVKSIGEMKTSALVALIAHPGTLLAQMYAVVAKDKPARFVELHSAAVNRVIHEEADAFLREVCDELDRRIPIPTFVADNNAAPQGPK
jgi:hypothetical protein